MLVLSLFPGIGLLDLAFEEAGFCVVRGPDLLWGGDVRRFHPPAGRFDGVIGGPPCQKFSGLGNLMARAKHQPENLIPEFERVVSAARPAWFLMENVLPAPLPNVAGYIVKDCVLNLRWLGEPQNRVRRFSFGTVDGRPLHVATEALEPFARFGAVTSVHKGASGRQPIAHYTVDRAAELQGLPADFLEHSPLRRAAQLKVIAQGVPLPMGRAIAHAVKAAL